MRKVYELDDHFFTGESTVQPVLLWGRDGRPLRERFSKTASEASDYIQTVQPLPGKSIVLVLAMGAYETYGLNRNGDGFNEHPYKLGHRVSCGHKECESTAGWVGRGELLTDHYKTFEEYGRIYKHHQNKDPAKSYGEILKAFWNPQMHRVELLLGIDNDKAPDIVQRIADGEYPAVSMGCKIKYDVCTICGHRAPTRAQYCDHLKFSMRQVMASGLQAGALNPTPKFFDISFVIKPADQTGYMLKKVAEYGMEVRSSAELGETLDRIEEKRAAIRKLSEMDKFVTGQTAKADVSPALRAVRDVAAPAGRRMPTIDSTTLGALSQHSPASVISTLGAAGVHLSTAELIKLLMARMAPGTAVPDEALDAATFLQPQILDLFEEYPGLLDQILATGALDRDAAHIDPVIAEKAQGYLEKRSTITEYLLRNTVPEVFRTEQRATTDHLHVTDPRTGRRFGTNRGAAIQEDDRISKMQLMKMLGGAALFAGAHKVVSTALPSALHLPAAGVTALAAGHFLRPDYGPRYMTDEGISIPASTELSDITDKTSSAQLALPLLGGAGLVAALSHDYESRLNRGENVHDPDAPIYRRVYDRVSEMANKHPAYSFLASLVGYGGLRATASKFAAYLGPVTYASTDSVTAPRVDFDRVAEKIGALLWP